MTLNDITQKLEELKESIANGDPTEEIIEQINFLLTDINEDHAQDSGYLSDDHLDDYGFGH